MSRIPSLIGMLVLASATHAQQPQPSQSANAEQTLDAAVAADWPRYDHGGKGHLTTEEFSSWLIELRTQSNGTTEDPAKLKAWADTSFAKADGNTDRQVTPEEFTQFLRAKIKK